MVRTVMHPEIRHANIMRIASELFNEKGYEQTSISDIVKKANVAQGTFYYYFKSKDDVLNAIIDKWITEIEEMLEELVQNNRMNALKKLFTLGSRISEISLKLEGTVNYVHEKKNEILHFRLMEKSRLAVTPFLEKIIQQGIDEGTFHTQYPKEAAMAILAISDFLGHKLASTQEEANTRLTNAIIEFTERILDIKNQSLLETYGSRKEVYREKVGENLQLKLKKWDL